MLSFSCEEGAPGPPGLNGLDGVNGEESYVFDYELNFTAPDYRVLLNLPNDFVMLDSDMMLVYFLWRVDDGVEIWRLLPQSLYFLDGILQYNYDFTKYDANIFLDGTVNFNGLSTTYTHNWIARIVVVPGQFTNGRSSIDYSDYNQVKELFNLSPLRISTENYTSRTE